MGLELLLLNPPADPYPLLALDPSTVAIGWAIIPEQGMVPASRSYHLSARSPLDERLAAMGQWLEDWRIITPPRLYAPRLVVVEVPDLSAATGQGMETTPETLKALWEAAGVIRECCRRAGIPMAQVDARRVRCRLVGLSGANKRAVQVALTRRGYVLPMREGKVDHDAADALALAVVINDEIEMLSRRQEG